MSDLDWVVLVNTGTDILPYGPMTSVEAQGFARFMTKEVDPATAFKLRSPLREVLGWHENETARNDCTHGPDCPVHLAGVSCPTWDCTHGDGCPVHPGIAGAHGDIMKLGGNHVGR